MKLQHPFPHLDCNFDVRESARAKRLNIRVKPPKDITLTIPVGFSPKLALAFVKDHESWIVKQLDRAAQRQENKTPLITAQSNFATKHHHFIFVPHDKDELFVRIGDGETRLYYPSTMQQKDEAVQGLVQLALRETYRIEAKSYLPQRLQDLAQSSGFTYNKVSIRDSKSLWGSCSGQKNISLSLSLMRLPYHLIDYILLHELCHTVEMNHSPRFHQLLNKACGGRSKQLNAELRNYSTLG